jgi:large subunit ribosomal protein L32e
MAEAMDASKVRKLKRKHPKFFRSNFKRRERKRVKDNWRKPRGIDNKKKEKRKTYGAEPNIGYGNRRSLRGIHPCGMEEIRVLNAQMLDGVKAKAVRIAGPVGGKKRAEIRAKAKALGLRVLN